MSKFGFKHRSKKMMDFCIASGRALGRQNESNLPKIRPSKGLGEVSPLKEGGPCQPRFRNPGPWEHLGFFVPFFALVFRPTFPCLTSQNEAWKLPKSCKKH